MGFNFRGWLIVITFVDLIFADASTRAHYVLYIQAFFVDLIFAVRRSSAKTARIGPLKNFPLYSRRIIVNLVNEFLGQLS